ncbi:MAG: 2-oxoglutarate ferredoxin oxidoreductase subunit beta [Phenylobacterium sp.]|jgi:2-oxoglutarate ferredoxin oxidoreductase subunit beta
MNTVTVKPRDKIRVKPGVQGVKLGPAAKRAQDYATDQEVRWCPGCGDYSILRAVQLAFAEQDVAAENTVFVSGIGCSSRFPYYMETYGFHTIHGRAPTIATGVKLANPELDVWVVTGDGDALSIGGNHLMHALRRNIGLNILLFNNEIYGLTKGQYSPTSSAGTVSPSSPGGSIDTPLSAGLYALGSGAQFIARAVDTDINGLKAVVTDAKAHEGASLVEIFQNCLVFNDKTFGQFTDPDVALDQQLHVKHGEPLLFGKAFGQDGCKGLVFNPTSLSIQVVDLAADEDAIKGVLVHDETNPTLAQLLLSMTPPALPVALGVVYRNPKAAFETLYWQQNATKHKTKSVDELLNSGQIWQR